MPTKNTTITSTTTRITNTIGDAYFVTKSTLREGVAGGYKLKLIDLKHALKGFTPVYVAYTHNGQSNTGYGTDYSARVYVEKKSGRIFRVTIGCQAFEGKNAAILMRAVRSAKPLALAATAGV